ncbi:hypothetical protein PENFLA_c001G01617 [Penicillium flavigenum]|uniref:Uncharacterized protein n=1 Tax=Penicillium flavigenum TaxID=254877 RepID=A0A1V6U1I2_9EURO|nr:hypothetical protein PENFLA_c001G01617 [Penicillium flavigenum]
MATREAGGYSRRIEPTESNVAVCERAEGSRTCGGFIYFSFKGRGGGTSLSVAARKAAERVVAQLDSDGGGWWVSLPQIIDQMSLSVNMRKAAGRIVASSFFLQGEGFGDVSVCERVEGSGACGGFIFRFSGGGCWRTSLSMNVWWLAFLAKEYVHVLAHRFL